MDALIEELNQAKVNSRDDDQSSTGYAYLGYSVVGVVLLALLLAGGSLYKKKSRHCNRIDGREVEMANPPIEGNGPGDTIVRADVP